MDLIIKRASELSTEEQTSAGISGIPSAWPVESYPYLGGDIDEGFEQSTDEALAILKGNNQAAYDAWIASHRPVITPVPVNPIDADNAPLTRNKVAPLGWCYQLHCVEFETTTLGSIYSKDASLSDFNFSTVKYYKDELGTQCSDQSDADANCIKTVVDWEPTHDYELICGSLKICSDITQDIRAWLVGVPDLPTSVGGSKLMASNVNLKFLAKYDQLTTDGRAAKHMTYSAAYHTGKLRLILRHPAGNKTPFLLMMEFYKQ